MKSNTATNHVCLTIHGLAYKFYLSLYLLMYSDTQIIFHNLNHQLFSSHCLLNKPILVVGYTSCTFHEVLFGESINTCLMLVSLMKLSRCAIINIHRKVFYLPNLFAGIFRYLFIIFLQFTLYWFLNF